MRNGIRISEKHGVNPSLDTCIYCGESKGVVLFGRMVGDKEAPRNVVLDYEPCDQCKSNMEQGITFLEADEEGLPTGKYWVVREEAVESFMLPESEGYRQIMEKRKAFVLPDIAQRIFGEFYNKEIDN